MKGDLIPVGSTLAGFLLAIAVILALLYKVSETFHLVERLR